MKYSIIITKFATNRKPALNEECGFSWPPPCPGLATEALSEGGSVGTGRDGSETWMTPGITQARPSAALGSLREYSRLLSLSSTARTDSPFQSRRNQQKTSREADFLLVLRPGLA